MKFLFHRSRHYIGRPIDGFYDDRYTHLIVGTEENVIAALSVESGDIEWRRVLEKGDRGAIQYLFPVTDSASSNSLRVSDGQETERLMVTVTGTSFVLVRGWNIQTGNLAWEWTASLTVDTSKAYWFYAQSKLYRAQPHWNAANIEVSAFSLKNGYQDDSTTKKISIVSSQERNCDFVQNYLVCLVNGEVTAIDLISGAKKVIGKSAQKPQVVKVRKSF